MMITDTINRTEDLIFCVITCCPSPAPFGYYVHTRKVKKSREPIVPDSFLNLSPIV